MSGAVVGGTVVYTAAVYSAVMHGAAVDYGTGTKSKVLP